MSLVIDSAERPVFEWDGHSTLPDDVAKGETFLEPDGGMWIAQEDLPKGTQPWLETGVGAWRNPQERPLKVSGYKPQSPEAVALVNEFKADEERLLRKLEQYFAPVERQSSGNPKVDAILSLPVADMRWVAIAKTHFQEGFMALNRAVFQPGRVRLPEDGE